MKTINNPSLSVPISFHGWNNDSGHGMSDDGVKRISDVFDRQFQDGLHLGAQLVVLRRGRVVLDRFEGFTDTRNRHRVTPETRFLTFSVTKPITSICVFKLVEDNHISLDSPVGKYWPEFSCNGKEEITVRQVLLHQSGLSKRGFVYQMINVTNWDKITQDLARQKPEFRPGTKTAYQYLNYGFILGEVIRRVSGLQIDEYLQREFLIPMGINNTSMRAMEFDSDSYARLCSGTLDHQLVAGMFNRANVRQAVIPAASLHSTARELAVFFQLLLNDGKYAGSRYLKPETVQLATSLAYEGTDEALKRKTRWGYGFSLGGDHILHPDLPDGMGSGSSEETFGHYGQRTSMGWADKKTGLVVIFLCNRFLSSFDYKMRLQEISDAVWDAVEE
jgi:CubicO group peptidase (beta-lactamase class C family)